MTNERLAMLLARQAERMAQQEHAEHVADFHRYRGKALEAAGVQHALLWDTDTRRGPLATYPIGFASVDWARVPHAVVHHGVDDEQRGPLLDDALRALDVAPETIVIVDWCRGGLPRIALSAADACTHAGALTTCAPDTWVYAEGAPWLVEIHHDDRLTYAARPGLPGHACDD